MSDPWKIAAWRFEIISALLDPNLTEAQKRRIIRERTMRAVQWPNSPDKKPIGSSTLFQWLKHYREKSFLGLMPKVRKDKGLPRSDRSQQVSYALGLLSNLSSVHKEPVARLGFAEHFEAVAYSCELGYRKPDPRLYLDLGQRLAAAPGATLVVGDSLKNDVVVPRELGMRALRVSGSHGEGALGEVAELGWMSLADGEPRRLLGNGDRIELSDLDTRSIIKAVFYEFLGKSPSRMKTIWMKNMLSGDGDPPESFASERELLDWVASTPGAIGYIDRRSVSGDVVTLVVIPFEDGPPPR